MLLSQIWLLLIWNNKEELGLLLLFYTGALCVILFFYTVFDSFVKEHDTNIVKEHDANVIRELIIIGFTYVWCGFVCLSFILSFMDGFYILFGILGLLDSGIFG